jgi:hypothetical protein
MTFELKVTFGMKLKQNFEAWLDQRITILLPEIYAPRREKNREDSEGKYCVECHDTKLLLKKIF